MDENKEEEKMILYLLSRVYKVYDRLAKDEGPN